MRKIKPIFAIIALFAVSLSSNAYDFTSTNNGVVIYYNKISSSEIAVTYKSGYNSYSGLVRIPETVVNDGKTYKVTEIGPFAFRDCSDLKQVVAENVKTVKASAFHNCPQLYQVFMSNIKSLGQTVFDKCPKLTEFTITRTVALKDIDSIAFKGCNIQKFTIWENLADQGYTQSKNLGTLLGDQVTEVTLHINEGTNQSTGNNLFANHPNLKKVIIADGRIIGARAFQNCKNLEEVQVRGLVNTIGEMAFDGCNKLKKITNITSYTPDSHNEFPGNLTTIGEYAFGSCYPLEEFTVYSLVTSIGEGAFHGCKNLVLTINNNTLTSKTGQSYMNNLSKSIGSVKKVVFGYNVKKIESKCMELAFQRKIPTIEIGENVSYLAEDAFGDEPYVDTLIIKSPTLLANDYYGLKSIPQTFSNSLKVVYIIGGTSIGNRAFASGKFEEIYINAPELKEIGSDAFGECSELKTIDIPDNVTTIKYQAFFNCSSLKAITIGKNISTIETSAFKRCSSLKEVGINSSSIISKDYTSSSTDKPANIFGFQVEKYTLGNEIKTIGQMAFTGCKNLKEVVFPLYLNTIGQFAFSGCTNLNKMKVFSATGIGAGAYQNCTGLKSIDLGYAMKSVAKDAFNGCTGLTSVGIPETVENLGNGAFDNCTNLTSVSVYSPKIMSKNYTAKENLFSIFGKQVKKYYFGNSETRTVLGDFALDAEYFDGSALEEIKLNNIATIGQKAFNYNKKLANVSLGDLISIGKSAFGATYSLASISLPSTLENIDDFAFEDGCLESIKIPGSVTSIGYGAFNCNGRLKTIVFGANMPSSAIGQFAFRECNSIESIIYLTTSPTGINANNFSDYAYEYATLSVASGMRSTFASLKGWENFYKIQAIINADVNRDGKVNATDVVSIYNYIINGEKSGITKEHADVNCDGSVNAADVVAVYNYIVNGL